MSRSIERLSAVAVSKRKEPGRLSDGGGLYLSVSASGSKSWVFMWTAAGRRREMGLGPYPAIQLKAAREKAAECRTLVADGQDPISEREKNRKLTFLECAELYIAAMEGTWRNDKHKYQWRQTLGCHDDVKRRVTYCESLRDRLVVDISTHDVLGVLSPIWSTKSETASRVRSRIELVLDFAKAKGWREGDNPARWRGHLRNVLGPQKKLSRGHMAAMPYMDVPAFIDRLKASDAVAARALEFTILTACRTSEVLKAQWSEFNLTDKLWTIPKHRMKAGEEHTVPLSQSAMRIVEEMRKAGGSGCVFPGYRSGKNKGKVAKEIGPLSSMAMEMLLRRMKVENATVHGFRSSFRDWCGDETDFPREIAEAALAHKVGSAVEQAYRRGRAIEKRRKLMEAWADYCNRASNVVQLRTA